MQILEDSFVGKQNSDTNRDCQVVKHLLFYKRKLVYCSKIFKQANAILTPQKKLFWSSLYCTSYCQRCLVLYFLFWKFSLFGVSFRISSYSRCSLINDLQIVIKAIRGRFTEIRFISPISLLHFLIFWSIWVPKFSFKYYS